MSLISSGSIKRKKCSIDGSDDDGLFLHGHLFIDVISAKDLPNMESWVAQLVDSKDVTDAFVDVKLGKAKLAKTSVILNDLDPVWNEMFRLEVCHWSKELLFQVRDKDHAYAEYIGDVRIPVQDILESGLVEGEFPILTESAKERGTLVLRIQFIAKSSVQPSYEVDSYFPMKTSNNVTLYQDACCPNVQHLMPQFQMLCLPDGSTNHQPASCWSDLYQSLMGANQIICITGWSVWDKLQLFRGEDLNIDNRTLGEILVDKSKQGVDIYVMVWSEKTSGEVVGEKGVMNTHDMETFHYFKNTKVNCALAPRELDCSELTDYLQNEFSTGTYTHHQKSVIVDAENVDGGGRRLLAYVGGLDLTGGRWDTPSHELYSTLLYQHLGDFRNSNAKSVPPDQGPRQPWHDIHMRVEGPIAHDVYLNFYERWIKQGNRAVRLDPLDTERSGIDVNATSGQMGSSWNCQLFRSITSDSAAFDPRRLDTMNSKKGRIVDSSITQAYIQMIRDAQHFIYIENQYFMGSSYCWMDNRDVSCHHIIPCEIAQKIVEKIYANERFCAYIVIPMFPEGDPTSAPIQEILYWQTNTMEMMYNRVGQALIKTGLDSQFHPTDYLLFLCPGKREPPGDHLLTLAEPTEDFAAKFRETLRFPIYVHSKMMIVDDSYVIVGSANINQRSMAGTRDTEMAIGAWQPNYTISNGQPFGDVHVFRMSLWTEHFRYWDPLFRFPSTLDCTRKVKEMAAYNWQVYNAGPIGCATPGQLLSYPLNILPDGSIEYLEGVESFPDFPSSAKIMGKANPLIPEKLTT